MENLDRLAWADGVCFRSYGVRIGVRVSKAEGMGGVLASLPPGWEPSAPPFVDYLYSLIVGGEGPGTNVRHFHLLYAGLQRRTRTMDSAEVVAALEAELQMLVAEWAPDHVFVHAGVVGWQGRAIVLPGRSLAGKSTLVRALLRAGADYYSDEYAVLDANGFVHPFPRDLSIRQPGEAVPRRYPPEEFGARRESSPLPVGTVVFSRYRAGETWRPQRLTAGRALVEMLDHTVPTQNRPARSLATVEKVVAHSQNLKGPRGDAEALVAALLGRQQVAA
jgi:hypothetical protein